MCAMSDSVEAQIAAEQAARRSNRDRSGQRESDKASLSVKNASFDSDIYGAGSSRGNYDTSIAVGSGNGDAMDEDLDEGDRPVRLVDSCEWLPGKANNVLVHRLIQTLPCTSCSHGSKASFA